ncbi:hypothetical protein ACP4OV_009116 [Aristida adscensionis]
MAGGLGPMQCLSPAQEEAEAAGEIGPMSGCSTKRKAMAAPAIGEKGPFEGSITKRKAGEPGAGGRVGDEPADAVEVVVGVDGGDAEEAPAREGFTRLPMDEVEMILSLEAYSIKPDDEETLKLFSQKTIQETTQAIREGAEASEEAKEKFLEFQAWVRRELEEKGYVEVSDESIAEREELVDWLQEEVNEMFKDLDIPDRYFDYGCDEEVEELALEC